jgi:hypothetical protein
MRGVSEKNAPVYLSGKQSTAIASVGQQLNLDKFVMLALKQKKAMSAHDAAPLKHGALPYKNLVPLCSPYYNSAHSDILEFHCPLCYGNEALTNFRVCILTRVLFLWLFPPRFVNFLISSGSGKS